MQSITKKFSFTALVLLFIYSFACPKLASANDTQESVSLEIISIEQLPSSTTSEGTATVTFKVTSGQATGETVTLSQHLWGHPLYDPKFSVGKAFTGQIVLGQSNEIKELNLHHDRKDYKLMILFGIVTIVLFIVGRWEGLIGLFCTVVTVLMIFFVFFPTIYLNRAILPAGIAICLVTIVLTVSFIMKWEPPTIPAILSLFIVFFAILFLTIFGLDFLSLSASKARHSRLILTWVENHNSLWRLLTIGIIIGSLGAMMDVAVVISSTVHEIARDSTEIGFYSAFSSGLKVGREILSTMLNTLVFAYMGILFPILLSLRIFNLSWLRFVNYDFVGIEILRIVIGLVGLSLVIPITSLLSAWWCRSS